jgi:hypothetical protein
VVISHRGARVVARLFLDFLGNDVSRTSDDDFRRCKGTLTRDSAEDSLCEKHKHAMFELVGKCLKDSIHQQISSF